MFDEFWWILMRMSFFFLLFDPFGPSPRGWRPAAAAPPPTATRRAPRPPTIPRRSKWIWNEKHWKKRLKSIENHRKTKGIHVKTVEFRLKFQWNSLWTLFNSSLLTPVAPGAAPGSATQPESLLFIEYSRNAGVYLHQTHDMNTKYTYIYYIYIFIYTYLPSLHPFTT